METTEELYYTLRDDIEELITYVPEGRPEIEHLITRYFDGRITFETNTPGYEGHEFQVTSYTREGGALFIQGPGLTVSLIGDITIMNREDDVE